jgi:hypothetical protein
MIEQFRQEWEVTLNTSDEVGHISISSEKIMIVRLASGLQFEIGLSNLTHFIRDVRIQCQGTQEPCTHLLNAALAP